MNFNKVCIVLRGVSGSSKSTIAKYLSILYNGCLDGKQLNSVICTADDYFYQDEIYQFNAQNLGVAHGQCKKKFLESINNNLGLVIVANTNSAPCEFNFYMDAAKEKGYVTFSLVVEKRFEGGDNGHNCPIKSLERQEINIKNSLKLR
jgi:hypothetical protein